MLAVVDVMVRVRTVEQAGSVFTYLHDCLLIGDVRMVDNDVNHEEVYALNLSAFELVVLLEVMRDKIGDLRYYVKRKETNSINHPIMKLLHCSGVVLSYVYPVTIMERSERARETGDAV